MCASYINHRARLGIVGNIRLLHSSSHRWQYNTKVLIDAEISVTNANDNMLNSHYTISKTTQMTKLANKEARVSLNEWTLGFCLRPVFVSKRANSFW